MAKAGPSEGNLGSHREASLPTRLHAISLEELEQILTALSLPFIGSGLFCGLAGPPGWAREWSWCHEVSPDRELVSERRDIYCRTDP